MSWMQLRMVGSKVLVRLDGKREKVGSIHIPALMQKQPQSAVVVEAGPRAPIELQPGVRVYTGKYNGAEIPAPEFDPDGEYRVCESDHVKPAPFCPDIYAVIEADAGEDVRERTSSDLHAVSIARKVG